VSEEERSAAARARAEQALVWVFAGLDSEETEMIVLGGLVPDVLSGGSEAAHTRHLGTTDVDILLVTHVDEGSDLSPLEKRLHSLGFHPREGGWRWIGAVEAKSVKIEFLCDLGDRVAEEAVACNGCDVLKAMNLRGTRFVGMDWSWRDLNARAPSGETLTVRARFAGLEGYLLSKCFAVRHRGLAKDYYDLPYVLIHNQAGGPRQAAELLRAGKLSGELSGLNYLFEEIDARFSNSSAYAAESYATQMLLVDPELEDNVLRTDATVAVAEFLEALGFTRPLPGA
jgi:hypothetical protein